MTAKAKVLFSVLMIAGVAGAPNAAPRQGRSASGAIPQPLIALTNANVLDLKERNILSSRVVVLRGGKIESVGAGPIPEGSEVIDLKGKYLVPGLIDAHTHLDSLQSARRALESGVTTVRSASVGSYRDVALRELAKSGALAGPDVVAAGVFVTRDLGDSVLADPELESLIGGVDTPEKLRKLVRVNLAHRVDVIKTRGTERAGLPETDPRKQVYTEAELRAVVEEAATGGIPVEAHAHGDEGALAAVRAGVRSIEHGTYLSESTLAVMKERGTFLVPTYTTVIDLIEPGGDYDHPALRIRAEHMLPRLRRVVQQAHRMGVRIATGADTAYGPESVSRISTEVANLVEIGLSPIEAIRSATTVAAELLRLEKATGAIEVGLEADLIAVEENPLEDIRALGDVLLVISNGRVGLNRLAFAKEQPGESAAR